KYIGESTSYIWHGNWQRYYGDDDEYFVFRLYQRIDSRNYFIFKQWFTTYIHLYHEPFVGNCGGLSRRYRNRIGHSDRPVEFYLFCCSKDGEITNVQVLLAIIVFLLDVLMCGQ